MIWWLLEKKNIESQCHPFGEQSHHHGLLELRRDNLHRLSTQRRETINTDGYVTSWTVFIKAFLRHDRALLPYENDSPYAARRTLMTLRGKTGSSCIIHFFAQSLNQVIIICSVPWKMLYEEEISKIWKKSKQLLAVGFVRLRKVGLQKELQKLFERWNEWIDEDGYYLEKWDLTAKILIPMHQDVKIKMLYLFNVCCSCFIVGFYHKIFMDGHRSIWPIAV